MQNIDVNHVQTLIVQNQTWPKEGPLAISMLLDFTVPTDGIIRADLSNYQAQRKMSMVQTVFIDLSSSGVPLAIMDEVTTHEVVANPHTQGFYTFVSAVPTKIKITCPGGPANVKVMLLNAPVPGIVWAATHP